MADFQIQGVQGCRIDFPTLKCLDISWKLLISISSSSIDIFFPTVMIVIL